ncbi:hypothetical protein FOZ63_031419, partial [Perkinsus olseni]
HLLALKYAVVTWSVRCGPVPERLGLQHYWSSGTVVGHVGVSHASEKKGASGRIARMPERGEGTQSAASEGQEHTLCIASDPYYLPIQPHRDPELPLLTTHYGCTRNHTRTYDLAFDPYLDGVDTSTQAVMRWLSHLLLAANDSCDWTYIIPKESYVNVDALHRRLGLFDSDEAWMFGRMVGRLSLVHAFYNGRRVKSPILRSGVIMSKRAATVLRDSHPSGQIDIDLAEAWILRSREEIPVGREQTHSVDGVGYREEDYAFAMYLVASTSFKLQLSNFGSYRQHFLIAEDVTRRLAARREALHRSHPPPSCVLHAWPITPDDALDLAHKTGLSELEALCTHCDDKLTKLVGASTYSWLEESTGEFIEEPYYSDHVKRALDLCQDSQLAPVLLRERNVQTYENGVVILAPPGQGTSWVFDNFKEGWPVDHEDAVVKADYWHPYCNEMYRHELSMVFSAAEDDTKENLLSLDFNSHALDAVVRLLTASGTKLVVTKE